METSDEDMARAAQDGDRDAFAGLLARHYDRLFVLTFRLTGSRADAEDLTQDICLALPRKLSGYRGDARFSTWLYRVAVNAAHDWRRRDASRSKAADGWGTWETGRRAAEAEAAADHAWLRTAMAALPEDLRETLALTLDDGMSHSDAAEILGVSEGTVSWRMSEVRKRLRALAAEDAG